MPIDADWWLLINLFYTDAYWTYWCSSMIIYADWFQLMLMVINSDWYWLLLIDANCCSSKLIDAGWCWFMFFDADLCQFMMIDTDWCKLTSRETDKMAWWNDGQHDDVVAWWHGNSCQKFPKKAKNYKVAECKSIIAKSWQNLS